MDVAFPFRSEYRRGTHDPLRYSIRAVWQHFRFDRMWLFGDRLPEWVAPDAVEFVTTDQSDEKFVNIGANIRAAARSRISPQFLWLNDDTFIIEDAAEIPLYCRREPMGELVEHLLATAHRNTALHHRQYVGGISGQYQLLKQWGMDDPIQCCDLHTPIPLVKERLKAVLDRARRDAPELQAGHFRALYGCGMPAVPMADVKIKGHAELPAPGAQLVSTSPETWELGQIGQHLRARYWRKSPFERGG